MEKDNANGSIGQSECRSYPRLTRQCSMSSSTSLKEDAALTGKVSNCSLVEWAPVSPDDALSANIDKVVVRPRLG